MAKLPRKMLSFGVGRHLPDQPEDFKRETQRVPKG